jgi:multicomponent Na+:H+ antiporter subunit E
MKSFILKLLRIIEFVLFYIVKVIQANIQLAYHILAPRLKMTPGILKYPVTLRHNQAILLLFNLISMTPGTLSMDLTDDRKYIYVHALFVRNQAKSLQEIQKLEAKIQHLFS